MLDGIYSKDTSCPYKNVIHGFNYPWVFPFKQHLRSPYYDHVKADSIIRLEYTDANYFLIEDEGHALTNAPLHSKQ